MKHCAGSRKLADLNVLAHIFMLIINNIYFSLFFERTLIQYWIDYMPFCLYNTVIPPDGEFRLWIFYSTFRYIRTVHASHALSSATCGVSPLVRKRATGSVYGADATAVPADASQIFRLAAKFPSLPLTAN